MSAPNKHPYSRLFVRSEFPEKETHLGKIIDDAVLFIQENSVTHNAQTETQSSESPTDLGQAKDQGRVDS